MSHVTVIKPHQVKTSRAAFVQKGTFANWYKDTTVSEPVTDYETFNRLVNVPMMEKYPLRFENAKGMVEVPDTYALVNRFNGATEGVVSKQYKITQPTDRIRDLFRVTNQLGYGAIAGGVDKGRVYALFDTGEAPHRYTDTGMGHKDLLVASIGFDGKTSDLINWSDFRIGCSNVMMHIISTVVNGLRILHKGRPNEKHKSALDAICKSKEALALVHKRYEKLAQTPLEEKDAIAWVIDTLNLRDKIEETGKVPGQVQDIMSAYRGGYGATEARGTLWDLLHAATYINNNRRGSDEKRMFNNVAGSYASQNRLFLQSALDYKVA
jgi:hypothetical protein